MSKLLTTKIHIVYGCDWIVTKSKKYDYGSRCTELAFLCCCIKIANLTEKSCVCCRSGCCQKCVEKYRLYRFCGMCSEWLCMAFQKIKTRNLENTNLTKKKSTLAGALVMNWYRVMGLTPCPWAACPVLDDWFSILLQALSCSSLYAGNGHKLL